MELSHEENPDAFHYVTYKTSAPKAPFEYTPRRHAPSNIVWPPKGLRVDFVFKAPFNAPAAHQGVLITVHYEIYDGIPLLAKWVTVENNVMILPKPIKKHQEKWPLSERENSIDSDVSASVLSVEYLAVNKHWAHQGFGWLDVRTDQPPHGINIQWLTDPDADKMPGSFQYNLNCSYSTYFT